MRTFEQKPKTTKLTTSTKASTVSRANTGQGHAPNSTLNLQRTLGNQALMRLLQRNAEEPNASLTSTTSHQLGHDFSQIRVTLPTAGAIQTKLTVDESRGAYEQHRCSTPARVARQPMDPRHARGFAGEQGMGFIHYRREDGWIFFEGPSGSAGHGVTQSGFDGVAYNVKTGEVHLVDNKSLARQGNVGSASAIDPSRNLSQNLDGLIQRVEAAKDVPGRVRLLARLRALKTSLVGGKPLPKDVKLVVTGVGGQSTGVTGRLQSGGVEFRPEPAPKNQPTAPTPTGTTPNPSTKVGEPSVAAPVVKPPAASGPTPTTTPGVEGKPSPAVVPPVRPTSTWKAGLKAGGKALGVALLFAGLEYLMHSQLEKELDKSIDEARHGAMPWARRLKREDPSKPVYMSVKIESKNYSKYVPFLGWMPEPPVLHMISIEMVRKEIDPPRVDVKDDRLNLLRPGVTTTVTYTEFMVS